MERQWWRGKCLQGWKGHIMGSLDPSSSCVCIPIPGRDLSNPSLLQHNTLLQIQNMFPLTSDLQLCLKTGCAQFGAQMPWLLLQHRQLLHSSIPAKTTNAKWYFSSQGHQEQGTHCLQAMGAHVKGFVVMGSISVSRHCLGPGKSMFVSIWIPFGVLHPVSWSRLGHVCSYPCPHVCPGASRLHGILFCLCCHKNVDSRLGFAALILYPRATLLHHPLAAGQWVARELHPSPDIPLGCIPKGAHLSPGIPRAETRKPAMGEELEGFGCTGIPLGKAKRHPVVPGATPKPTADFHCRAGRAARPQLCFRCCAAHCSSKAKGWGILSTALVRFWW